MMIAALRDVIRRVGTSTAVGVAVSGVAHPNAIDLPRRRDRACPGMLAQAYGPAGRSAGAVYAALFR